MAVRVCDKKDLMAGKAFSGIAFLAGFDSKERAAEKVREDREADRSRSGSGREQTVEKGKQGIEPEGRKSSKRSRYHGPQL